MITYEDVLELGWKPRHEKGTRENFPDFEFPEPGYDYHIMAIHMVGFEEDKGQLVTINCVPEETAFNEWENSDCHFFGWIKTKEDLRRVMGFVGVIEYQS